MPWYRSLFENMKPSRLGSDQVDGRASKSFPYSCSVRSALILVPMQSGTRPESRLLSSRKSIWRLVSKQSDDGRGPDNLWTMTGRRVWVRFVAAMMTMVVKP